jgi:hypothetical protein
MTGRQRGHGREARPGTDAWAIAASALLPMAALQCLRSPRSGRACAVRDPLGGLASSDMLRQHARCSVCGWRGATLQHPSWAAAVPGGVVLRLKLGRARRRLSSAEPLGRDFEAARPSAQPVTGRRAPPGAIAARDREHGENAALLDWLAAGLTRPRPLLRERHAKGRGARYGISGRMAVARSGCSRRWLAV